MAPSSGRGALLTQRRRPKYLLSADEPLQQAIKRELDAANDLGLRIVIPHQGDRYRF